MFIAEGERMKGDLKNAHAVVFLLLVALKFQLDDVNMKPYFVLLERSFGNFCAYKLLNVASDSVNLLAAMLQRPLVCIVLFRFLLFRFEMKLLVTVGVRTAGHVIWCEKRVPERMSRIRF